MANLPVIANVGLAAKLAEAIGIGIASDNLLDVVNGRESVTSFLIDVGVDGTPGLLAMRQTNDAAAYASSLLGVDTGLEVPTSEEIKDNFEQWIGRVKIGTVGFMNEIILESPEQESQIRRKADELKERGDRIIQVIADAANGDKTFARDVFRYINGNLEDLGSQIDTFGDSLVESVADVAKGWYRAFVDLVASGDYARPRKSGDGKRVSKEIHEYNYLSQPIFSYDRIPEELAAEINQNFLPTGQLSHIDVAHVMIVYHMVRGVAGTAPALQPGADANAVDFKDFFDDEDYTMFDPANFSYGNFVDGHHVRKLLANLKKLVQSVRSANVKEILELKDQTQSEFIWEILTSWPPQNFVRAANDIAIMELGNERNVRKFSDANEIVQVLLDDQG